MEMGQIKSIPYSSSEILSVLEKKTEFEIRCDWESEAKACFASTYFFVCSSHPSGSPVLDFCIRPHWWWNMRDEIWVAAQSWEQQRKTENPQRNFPIYVFFSVFIRTGEREYRKKWFDTSWCLLVWYLSSFPSEYAHVSMATYTYCGV